MTDNDTMGAWAKYAWAIVIGAFILLVCSAIAAFILTPKLGMSAMFIPLCMGVIILGFVLFNGDKFRRV